MDVLSHNLIPYWYTRANRIDSGKLRRVTNVTNALRTWGR